MDQSLVLVERTSSFMKEFFSIRAEKRETSIEYISHDKTDHTDPTLLLLSFSVDVFVQSITNPLVQLWKMKVCQPGDVVCNVTVDEKDKKGEEPFSSGPFSI